MSVDVHTVREPRAVWQAIWKGMKCRCPNCGKGKLFRAYLKVADTCANCGEELKWHRADDMPPYISIIIVGHLIIGVMMELESVAPQPPWVYLATMVPAALLLPLLMLPSIKGGVVGLQWANYMHGFDPRQRPAPTVA
ncbi:MAG: DUF983 domain-containing protein [Hyphomicrobiales bacterium]|nr:MAG: DUF983 domain-containing protein [Hyphomicrobiales bacterium]